MAQVAIRECMAGVVVVVAMVVEDQVGVVVWWIRAENERRAAADS